MTTGLDRARQKMQDAGASPAAIDVFSHYYRQLEEGATGLIAESDLSSLPAPTRLDDVALDLDAARAALARVKEEA